MIKSVCHSSIEVLLSIMYLYKLNYFDLDCTYGKGMFWRGIPEPKNKSDIEPQAASGVIIADSEDLPYDDDSFDSIVYDPPFILRSKPRGDSLTASRFGSYRNMDALKKNYFNTLKELYRVCKDGGIVVMKCQDTTYNVGNFFTHIMVMNMAVTCGFYPKDLFILVAKSRMKSHNITRQKHARKFHSYFWVFEKRSRRENYFFI